MYSTLDLYMLTPASDIICPRYSTEVWAKEHFDNLQYIWFSNRASNTVWRCCTCSSKEELYTRISSKKPTHIFLDKARKSGSSVPRK